ncbi:MAG: DNA glycosylase [Clostridia bacterium]|nr:DNA glycosylase [Clostridia bacterium]
MFSYFFAQWFKTNGRQFPWRNEGISPFTILVTEILLRRTRAESVQKVWSAFFNKYPDPVSLAKANPSELYTIVNSLGFMNRRISALLEASNYIIDYYQGQLPADLEQLLEIPHVGDYIARATLCFGHGHRIEIVDANILRFFARFYRLEVTSDIRRNPRVWELARQNLPEEKKHIKSHNYGLLDFTSIICKPVSPNCLTCTLKHVCQWNNH